MARMWEVPLVYLFGLLSSVSVVLAAWIVWRVRRDHGETKSEKNGGIADPANMYENVAKMFRETAELNLRLMQELADLKNQVSSLQLRKVQEDASSNLKGAAGNLILAQMLADIYGENTKGRLWDTEYVLEGAGRPDAVVMFGEKIVPIDSKNVQNDFVAYMEGKSDLRSLVSSLTRAAKEVAKYVRPDLGTSDEAILFIPSEILYYEVFVKNFGEKCVQNMLGECRKAKVRVCSPGSLYVELARMRQEVLKHVVEKDVSHVFELLGEVRNAMERNVAQLDAWETRFKNVLSELTTLRNSDLKMLEKMKKLDANDLA